MLGKEIHITACCLAKMEASEDDKDKINPLTKHEFQLLTDMANHEGKLRNRVFIETDTEISQSALKPILKKFEEQGWINRPRGPRSGYGITDAGKEYLRKISQQ